MLRLAPSGIEWASDEYESLDFPRVRSRENGNSARFFVARPRSIPFSISNAHIASEEIFLTALWNIFNLFSYRFLLFRLHSLKTQRPIQWNYTWRHSARWLREFSWFFASMASSCHCFYLAEFHFCGLESEKKSSKQQAPLLYWFRAQISAVAMQTYAANHFSFLALPTFARRLCARATQMSSMTSRLSDTRD